MKKIYKKKFNLDYDIKSLKPKRFPKKKLYLSGKRILPKPITGKESVIELLEKTFLAYNSARLREACQLFSERILQPEVTVGMSLAGALTPAGLGPSVVVPLIKAGFVDWIVCTGAILYHDLHFAFNLPLYVGSPFVDDTDLRINDIVRIYDIFLSQRDCLIATDIKLRKILTYPEFQKEMSTAELHHLLGKYAAMAEEENDLKDVSILAAAYRAATPIYCSAPGDSSIALNMAEVTMMGGELKIKPAIDVNETSAIVWQAKRTGGKSAAFLIGGGSPKNFVLQTEPQIQQILGLDEAGHDYFLQITDARPDTGGLSGATPHEAVSWGKVDPNRLPDAIVCYVDATIALPIITHYALSKHKPRKLKRLYLHRQEFLQRLTQEYLNHIRK
ncbi:MAG: deoxyhypusine synthase [candidate division WOR-3 bacterium]|nr:deoxyhypusine synthase [candidate division WOR-3 bacterium]MDH5684069.1 deoxyhypusine synthase [candidate division WOR-3 bacterium]